MNSSDANYIQGQKQLKQELKKTNFKDCSNPNNDSDSQPTQKGMNKNESQKDTSFQSFDRFYSSFANADQKQDSPQLPQNRGSKNLNNANSMRSQEYIDQDDNRNHRFNNSQAFDDNNTSIQDTSNSNIRSKPISIGLKAVRRASQINAATKTTTGFLSSEKSNIDTEARGDSSQANNRGESAQQSNSNHCDTVTGYHQLMNNKNDYNQHTDADWGTNFNFQQTLSEKSNVKSQQHHHTPQINKKLNDSQFASLQAKSAQQKGNFGGGVDESYMSQSSQSEEKDTNGADQEVKGQKRLTSKAGRKKRKEKRKDKKLQGLNQSVKSDVIMVSNMQNFQIGVANMPMHTQNDFPDDHLMNISHFDSQLDRHKNMHRAAVSKEPTSSGHHKIHGAASTGFSHPPLNRIELERKRNLGYDQKFLFKKNFISKYQPNISQVASQPSSHVMQPKNHHYLTPGKKTGFDGAKRYDGGVKVKGSHTTGHKSKNQTQVMNTGGELTPSEHQQQPLKLKSQAAKNLAKTGGKSQQTQGPNDLPRIEQINNRENSNQPHTLAKANKKFRVQKNMLHSEASMEERKQEGILSGSTNINTVNFQKNEDKELSAVRQRIGTLLSSNHVLEENNNTKDFFKKDMAPLNNPFMRAAEQGLAPPPNNYLKSRPSDKNSELLSETTVRSRGSRVDVSAQDMGNKAHTQKVFKKKAETMLNTSDQIALADTKSIRRQSTLKLQTSSLMTDNIAMHKKLSDNQPMPQHLGHRHSQQLTQQSLSLSSATAYAQHQSQQQRTQSNPNNKVTAFIKIQHMPAEILLQQQAKNAGAKQPQPPSHSQQNHSTNNQQERGYHMNAMMAQQRVQESSNISDITQSHQGAKMSPYGNSQIKSWGRPIKGKFQQSINEPLNVDKSLIVTDSTGKKKELQQSRQMSIARNVQQMGQTSAIQQQFTRKNTQKSRKESNSLETSISQAKSNFQIGGLNATTGVTSHTAKYMSAGVSSGVLEPGVGISGISINDKQFKNFNSNTKSQHQQSYYGGNIVSASQPHQQQQPYQSKNGTTAAGSVMPAAAVPSNGNQTRFMKSPVQMMQNHSAIISSVGEQHQQQLNGTSTNQTTARIQQSFVLNPISALDIEILSNQQVSRRNGEHGDKFQLNLLGGHSHQLSSKIGGFAQDQNGSQMNDSSLNYGVAQAYNPSAASGAGHQIDALMTNGNKKSAATAAEMDYARHNSDQTAYLRNMRSVLHHNSLQQKNNIGTQQLSQNLIQNAEGQQPEQLAAAAQGIGLSDQEQYKKQFEAKNN